MDDPLAVWMCPSEYLRARTLYALYSTRLGQMLAHGQIWTDFQRSTAAVWLAPGARKPGVRPNASLCRCLLDPRLTVRAPLLALGMRRMERAHPHGAPHWYLSLLATDPACRGQGLGSAVLAPVLASCDAEGMGAYLESSKRRNVDFYAHHGFREIGALRLPSGPELWLMWREPREHPDRQHESWATQARAGERSPSPDDGSGPLETS
jgi:ribosomal protein S18 acetylase RimI-like enzyme